MSPFSAIPPEEHVAANELAFAIWDRFPVSPGHSLVVTRREVATWWDASGAEQAAVLDLVEKLKWQLDRSHAPDGYNVGFNAGDAAGQTVPHLHVHVIPRYHGDVPDPRGGIRHAIPSLGNYLTAPSAPAATPSLVTDGRLYLELVRCLINPSFDRIDLLVSFVMRSGVDLLHGRLDEAVARGARVRLLTTDYLGVTDVGALGYFLDRVGEHPSGGGLEARVFSDPATSFHPKAYLFSSTGGRPGVAFVGSSNLSVFGLLKGVEWNVESRSVGELLDGFERLWADERCVPLTEEWLTDYHHRRVDRQRDRPAAEVVAAGEEPEETLEPWSVQREALDGLEAARLDGHRAGLVVMATGLGKTWLAAFDSTRPEFRRVLFVAHREEILTQARDVYRRVQPDRSLTFFVGGERDLRGDVVFAGIQSLQRNLDALDPEDFDYVVVDEFHHAAARTYRRLLGHLRPKFLLGLTATPDRADAADLLALCGDNLVYECGLLEGVRRDLLSPFRYRAIRDVADYEHIPWRSGRFDVEMLSAQLETLQRSDQVYTEWEQLGGSVRRALGFCCSISHADFMARYFSERGVAAVAVHSGPLSSSRQESLARLEAGDVDIIFTVDLFNEGVDVPAVDLVLLLRPTESPVVFFQQLGRGLRTADGKDHLDVLDLVGNHRSFLLKARLLAALAGYVHLTDREAVGVLADSEVPDGLPPGCSIIVDVEAIDLLTELLGRPSRRDRLAEVVRTWVEDHEGARPTALEAALTTGQPHDQKRQGGWFGFLNQLGLLSDGEREAFELARDFLVEVEHGAYTKSFKLVSLQAMLDMGTLRSSSPLRDLALSSRWQVFRDPRLRADLADAGGSFADPVQPTDSEWLAYWRRNPINALAGGNRSDGAPWFTVDDASITLHLSVPSALGRTFDDMVQELIDYRLHRYLVSVAARRPDERIQPIDGGGRALDAGIFVEQGADGELSVLFESAGGASQGGLPRNPDYVAAVDLVLARLGRMGATVRDAYVDSTRVRQRSLEERRLDPGEGRSFPIELADVDDVTALRRAMLRSMAAVGRESAAAGQGNSRKAFRLEISDVATGSDLDKLRDWLRTGVEPQQPANAQPAVVDGSEWRGT